MKKMTNNKLKIINKIQKKIKLWMILMLNKKKIMMK